MNGVVFAVDGQQRDFMPGYRGHNDFSGGDENFFVGERDVLSVLDCFVGGGQTDDADGGRDYGVRVGMRGDAFDALQRQKEFRRACAPARLLRSFQNERSSRAAASVPTETSLG